MRGRRSLRAVLAVAAFAAAPVPVAMADTERVGTFSLVFENDLFANTDRGYTSGQRLIFVTPPVDLNSGIAGWVRQLPFFAEWREVRTEYSLNQAIFTPTDTTRPNPDPRDRPYAGWLEASFGLIGESKTRDYLDQLSIGIGVVGPASLGEASQKLIHILRRIDIPQGWAFQLHNEPTVQLRFQRSLRLSERSRSRSMIAGLGFDVMPHYGFTLGNAYTYGNVGLTVRFGEDLRDDYGPPRVSPSVPGSTFFVPRDRFGWYVFASAEGRAQPIPRR
jgi:lipid A 3-O-deacylase